jgi:hypothetical protein
MDTACLARHYDHLTPPERVPLIIAATLRGDDVERERLIDTAPVETFGLPDYQGHAFALSEAGKFYRMEQLELVAQYWHCMMEVAASANAKRSARRAAATDSPDKGPPFEKSNVWIYGALCTAYRYRRNREGWEIFCRGMSIDPDTHIAPLIGSAEIERIEAEMPESDLSTDELVELAAALKIPGPPAQPFEAITAEEIAERWRKFVDRIVREWE